MTSRFDALKSHNTNHVNTNHVNTNHVNTNPVNTFTVNKPDDKKSYNIFKNNKKPNTYNERNRYNDRTVYKEKNTISQNIFKNYHDKSFNVES